MHCGLCVLPMPLALESSHTLPRASGSKLPLPSCKQASPVSPLFAALTESVHPVDSTSLTRPLFSCSYALFCTERQVIFFLCNALRTLCEKHRGCTQDLPILALVERGLRRKMLQAASPFLGRRAEVTS